MPGPEILKHILMRMCGDKGHKGQNRRTYVRLGHFGFDSLVSQLARCARSLNYVVFVGTYDVNKCYNIIIDLPTYRHLLESE